MSNLENYVPWDVLSKNREKFIVDKLEDTNEGLLIYISNMDKKNRYAVKFDPYIAYRNMDESFRGNTISYEGGFDQSLYIVENSKWKRWFDSESLGYYSDSKITHYSIITSADWVDVLSEFEPEVHLL